MRLIPPAIHFVQDTFIAAVLILGPLVLPLGELARWLSVGGGVSLLVYNGLTDRPGSLYPLFGESVHRVLDYGGIIALLLGPWLLFVGFARHFFLAMGVVAFALAVLVDFTPDPRPARPFGPRVSRWFFTQAIAFGLVAGAFWLWTRL